MTSLLLTFVVYCIWAYVTWVLFLAIMDLKKARDAGKLSKTARIMAMPLLAVGYLMDFGFNVLSSFLFLEVPQELLFTARVSRHIKGTGWRSSLAKWFCETLLNPFDEGHCGN